MEVENIEFEEDGEELGQNGDTPEPSLNPGVIVRQKGGPQWADVLTDMQQQYCWEYVKDFNQRGAAIRCGYSPGHASTTASQMMKMPKIRARIIEIIQSKRAEYAVDAERIQTEIARIAFFDATEVIDAEGSSRTTIRFKSLKDIPKRIRPAIKGWTHTKYGVNVMFHDKLQALDMLNKHIGYYAADNLQKSSGAVVAIYLPDNGRGDRQIEARDWNAPIVEERDKELQERDEWKTFKAFGDD